MEKGIEKWKPLVILYKRIETGIQKIVKIPNQFGYESIFYWEERNMKKKLVSSLLCLTMLAGCLTGCGGGNGTGQTNGGTEASGTR